ncbi:MAG: CoB--CoM heterodisulfide reductase iron-sulfur subunit B family protein [Candidatus Eremiobacteraeota bacterium]|nr:CoB--CoM heterodisulfide reductase iron-sulfur subunit B family protein [Candidatus Eremiobacteraeota bacterium]
MKLGYFPGCLADSSAREYDMSLKAVFHKLGLELEEVHDWNCCGAFEASCVNQILATALPARNLALFSKNHETLVISCAACYSNHAKANFHVKEDPAFREKIENVIEDKIAQIEVRHPLEIMRDMPPEKIRNEVKKPLKGLKFIPYYGCNFLRPSKVLKADNPENPTLMEGIIEALGGEALPFPLKARCCGGALLMADKPLSLKMTTKLWEEAQKLKPDAIVVLCPQCSMTLETLADEIESVKEKIPVIYFTQLIGLAFGIDPEELGLSKNLISTEALVEHVEKIKA